MTGLYDASVENLIRGPLEHRWSVQFYDAAGDPIDLDVTDAEVTFDEQWWPYVQGTITAVPTSQAVLDALDPRQIVRCVISAGYVLPGRVEDVHPIAELYLTRRVVRRPDNDVVLSVQGPEYLFGRSTELDGVTSIIDLGTWSSTTEARDAINSCLYAVGYPIGWYPYDGSGWDYEGASRITGWSGDVYWDGSQWVDESYGGSLVGPGATAGYALDIARDIASRVDAWLRCDETGTWRCSGYPTLGSVSAHQLKVGAQGTVISSQTTMERTEDWCNTVSMHVTWQTVDGPQDLWGTASVTSGPYAVDQVGIVATIIERDVTAYMPQSRIQAMAASLLRRALAKGRSIALDAVAAYWLRPGHTVTITLPLGPQERHLISAVTYRLTDGSMSLTTRVPDNASEITIGG